MTTTARVVSELIPLDALGPGGSYGTHQRLTITDVTGTPVAELSQVPTLFVTRTISALRQARPLPLEQRIAALERAAQQFAHGVVAGHSVAGHSVAGHSVEDYQQLVSRVSGLPVSVVHSTTLAVAEAVAQAYGTAQQGRPRGALTDWREAATEAGHAAWTRRGGVFAVHAAGNHPGIHALWTEALALGYRVAVRLSRREPFTPHRVDQLPARRGPEDGLRR